MTTLSSNYRITFSQNKLWQVLLAIFLIAWLYFFATTRDTTNWWIENILVILFIPWFYYLHKRFLLSDLSVVCIFLFLLMHSYGAQMSYTYNQVGAWLQDTYHLSRNPYDRFVHFNFGFLIAYPVLDYLVNRFKAPLKYAYGIMIMFVLSLATIFELIEWTVAALTDSETGETYVATQGDVWDAHKDIALALLASIIIAIIHHFYKNNKLSKLDSSTFN